jgi:hypothetical protein
MNFGGSFVELSDSVELNNLVKFTHQQAKQFFGFPLCPDGLGKPNQ